MVTFEEFKDIVAEQKLILKRVIRYWNDFKFLSTPDNAMLIKFFSKYPIFQRSQNAMFDLLCIELFKLHSSSINDSYRFKKTIHQIKEHKKNAEWKNRLNRADIEKLDTLIKKANDNHSLENIENYRHQYIAHSDPKKEDAEIWIKFLDELIRDSVKIVNLLRNRILNEKTPLELELEESGFKELKDLAEMIEMREQ